MDLSKVKQKFSYKLFGIGGETELEITNEKSELKRGSRGVDYSQLRKFLKKGDWRAADEETRKVMCRVAAREKEGWLDQESIDNFPCEDLQQINQLWEHYSKGKFGFSVQKKIYENLGGNEGGRRVWEKFCERVGWKRVGEDKFIEYSDLTFNLKNAPQGHLPLPLPHIRSLPLPQDIFKDHLRKNPCWVYHSGVGVVVLFSVETCNL